MSHWTQAHSCLRTSRTLTRLESEAARKEAKLRQLQGDTGTYPLLQVESSSLVAEGGAGLLGVLKGSPLSLLLVTLPLGFYAKAAGWSPEFVFASLFIGIVPLAWLIGKSTEDLAAVTGEVLGGLLNATFGNVVEMMLCIASITQAKDCGPEDKLVITKCTLLGSILSNLLLVMGCACIAGGYFHKKQTFSLVGAQVQIVMLLLAILTLGLPTAYSEAMSETPGSEEAATRMSRYLSVLLLVAYGIFLYFQIIAQPDVFNSESEEEEAPPDMCWQTASLVLAVCTAICAFATDDLIETVQGTIDGMNVSQEFIGIVLLPIIGNAAEHYTAITVAMQNKMDLALGVAVGSSCQMALLVAPFTVLVGWVADKPMNLDFHAFQLFILMGSVLVVAGVLWSGGTNWLYGAMMCVAYVAVSVVYFVQDKNVSTFQDRDVVRPPCPG